MISELKSKYPLGTEIVFRKPYKRKNQGVVKGWVANGEILVICRNRRNKKHCVGGVPGFVTEKDIIKVVE